MAKKMSVSGLIPKGKPQPPQKGGTPGLGAARFNLSSPRKDMMSRKGGKKGC